MQIGLSRFFVGLTLLLSLTWVSVSQANDLKIGFVNIRQLIASAPQIEQIQEKLVAEFTEKRQAIIKLRNEIAQIETRYDKQTDKGQQLLLQKSLDSKQLELSKMQQFMQDEYNLRRNEVLGKVQSLIVEMVAKVSKEKQLDIVFNNTGVIYVNQRIDITPDVFKYLSEQRID